jgi:hypothetical protein
MVDLFTHFVTLDVLRARLGVEVAGGAAVKRVVTAYKALQAYYPYAVLGSVIDHLLAHDGPSDTEVSLLQDASALWATMRAFQLDFRNTRQEIEQVAANPADPTAFARYNAARKSMADLIDRQDSLVAALQAFRWKLFPLGHLTPHPRGSDAPVKAWPWRDVVLSRRTGAFAATVMKLARSSATDPALAFGVGVLASYAANSIGSPFLVHCVGGPRRSHPYRDRLASYAVGAWLRAVSLPVHLDSDPTHFPPVFGSPNAPSLPPWLGEMILKALHLTYGVEGPSSPPRLDIAYPQMLRHWQLLQMFSPLPQPAPIAGVLRLKMNATLSPADYDRPDEPTPTGGTGPAPSGPTKSIFDPGPGAPPWFRPDHQDVSDWIAEICEDILLFPFFVVRFSFYLGHKAGDKKPSNTSSSRSALSVALSPADYTATTSGKDILIAVDELFYLDNAIQQLAIDCLRLLKYLGLIYPEAKDLGNPEFWECLIVPPASLGFKWPARPLSDPNLFLDMPATPLERPPQAPSAFAPGEKPIAILLKGVGGGADIFDDGFDLLHEELTEAATSPVRTTNLDLDADRGVGKICWTVKPKASIKDDPVPVVDLGYGDV